ncbi:hypothetical protein L1987_06681 [Smallanthus sonchifolius]|uniref:Uncharacterized protein n=1 Tax=Smallanthus sonchifolius TaxID=185202 RepID=A0ACB9JYW6_9ASTR|nr:hypothetical protein L1987_06681 [Smallanthus sonchifolius]
MLGEEHCSSLFQLQRLIFSGSGYQLQSWRSVARCNHPKLLMICLSAATSVDAAKKPIRSNSGLRRIRLSAADKLIRISLLVNSQTLW